MFSLDLEYLSLVTLPPGPALDDALFIDLDIFAARRSAAFAAGFIVSRVYRPAFGAGIMIDHLPVPLLPADFSNALKRLP